MKSRNLALVAALAWAPVTGPAAAQQAVDAAPVDPALYAFSSQVRSCTAATASQPHPLMPGFVIEHAVTGMHDGLCDYSQTMPGNMHMRCSFDDATGKAFADEIEHTALTGRMAGSSSGAQPAWRAACEIETASGKRLPMGGP